MGDCVMVSLWYESLLTKTRFRFFSLEWTIIVKRIWCKIKKNASKQVREAIKL